METGTEQPAPERVLFQSPYTRLQVHLRREQRGFTAHGVVEVVAALVAEFHDGLYETEDPEVVRLMRASAAFKRGDVFEAKAGVFGEPKPANVRGPVSSRDLTGTTVKSQKPDGQKPALKQREDKTTKCDICGAEFKDDFRGSRVRMHKVSHRKSLAKAETNAPASPRMEEGPGA